MTTAAERFDVLACPLAGTRLIEASAGTGKTWNLCGIYLRLLLERAFTVQQILVVTFTNAATADLRERIRSRIVETLAHLGARGASPAVRDRFVGDLVASLRGARGLDDATLAQRLDAALQTFDEASIFTIHGFCQRALADAPFAAQMPLALEALADDAELIAEAASDFWRREVAGGALPAALAAHLVERGDSPASWARLLERRLSKPLACALWPRALDAPVADFEAPLQAAYDAARTLWQAEREAIVGCVQAGRPLLNGNTYKATAIDTAARGWDELFAGSDALAKAPEKIELLASALMQARAKNGDTPEHPFFAVAQALLDLRESAATSLTLQRLALLRRLLDDGAAALRDAKRRRRVIAFDDMLFNMHQRLVAADASAAAGLAASLRRRFPAALIDEFQDTDPLQFAIFEALYRGSDAPLFLVGDPKQAIYSFRNADLHTYLRARDRADAEYTLVDNQRSTPGLIDALNGLFGTNERAFMQDGLAYRQVGVGAKERKPLHDATGQDRAPLQVWQLPEAPLPKRAATAAAVAATAAEIARLVAAGQRGDLRLGDERLRAGDIAVLVRSHAHGRAMREALAAVGVGSVELSRASVLHSRDAEELARVLAAILEPGREPLLKAALATELLGLDAGAIAALADDEATLMARMQRFAAYRDAWIARGIGFMLRELLHAEGLPARLLARSDGERRLTNCLHLAECLHQAAETHGAPDALLRWFDAQRHADGAGDDAAQLRLESDQNLVQIVTVHKAKGLEYAFVFCPLLWDGAPGGRPRNGRGDGIEYHDAEGQGVVDFRAGLDDAFDAVEVQRCRHLESASEELRLIYVALTRAVHRCVLVAGGYETKAGKAPSTKQARASLLNWLVAGAGIAPAVWLDAGAATLADVGAAWRALAAWVGPAIGIAPLPDPASLAAPPVAAMAAEPLAALAPPPSIGSGWRIGSYSALAQGATHEGAAADHDLRIADAATAATAAVAGAALAADDILRFPRGAAAGIALHSLFERVDFGDASTWPAPIAAVLAELGDDRVEPRMLQQLLRDVLATPLPVGTAQPLRLADVPRASRRAEVEFHLPVRRLAATTLNALLADIGLAAPRLDFATLRGYLKGFIDAVVEHEGRYFVVDWKSNHLGNAPADYAAASLDATMAEQGYHVQALLYAVALDRLLRRRVPGYAADRHFGGVLYLFVRGVRPGWTQPVGRPCGMHFQRPGAATLARASSLLFDAAAPA